MRTHGKKYRAAVGTLEPRRLYTPAVAVEQVKQAAYAKFDESVDVGQRVGIPGDADRQPAGVGDHGGGGPDLLRDGHVGGDLEHPTAREVPHP